MSIFEISVGNEQNVLGKEHNSCSWAHIKDCKVKILFRKLCQFILLEIENECFVINIYNL